MRRTLVKVLAIAWLALGALPGPLGAQQPPTTAEPSPPAPAGVPATAPSPPVVPAPAQLPTLPPELVEPIKRLSSSIETAEKSIQQLKELESELQRLRTDVEHIIYESTATAEGLRPQLAEVRSQIEKLGPPPAKDQPPESATVAAERARLNALAGALDGAVKTTELAWVRAKQLIDRITVMRYQLFTRNLLERRDSPVLPGVWRDVASRMELVAGRVRYYGNDWMSWASRKSTSLMALLAAVLAVYAIGQGLARIYLGAHLARPETSPTFFARTAKAAWTAPLRMLAPVLAALLLYFGLDGLDLLFAPWDGPASTLLKGALVYAAASALLAVAFAPSLPAWRLIPVSDATARRLVCYLKLFVGAYVLDTVLVDFGRIIYVPLSVTIAQAFLISLLFVGLLAALLLTPFEPQFGPDRPVNGHQHVARAVTRLEPLWIKLPLWLAALVILLASVLGYIALGRFVAHQLVLSGIVVGAAGLAYLAIRAATRGRDEGSSILGAVLESRFGFDAPRGRQISRLTEFIGTFAVGLLALPILLVQWGFSGADIRDWLKALLFGFEIGQFRISLVRILIGIGLFTALLFATRLIQRWLRDRVLAQQRVDAGIANSIETAVGYAGTALALLLAVSYAGFDVTSLAIVAGALSVGIGFGLQSIVNNFVSGLILLVERPIKVGDWIVVGTEQGNVRRISVRSTEIETFDRASLIIPNSELVMGRVLNLTHRNVLGRSHVKITVDANADPDRILKILRICADAHPEVLKTPAPAISFDNFSASGLDFTIRATVGDVTRSGAVGTELRTLVLKALRDDGTIFPNPQYDVHLRDLDWLKVAAQRIAEQKMAETAAASTAPAPHGGNTMGAPTGPSPVAPQKPES